MNLFKLAFALVYICVGVVIGIVAMQQDWHDWLYKNLPYLLIGLILVAVVLALASVLGYLALKWWIKRELNIKADLAGEEVVVGLADKLTNRDALDAPDAQDRMHSLMVNLGLYYVRSVAMQRYLLIIGGTFTALVGLATVFLLYEQNKKLDIQTRQIEIQSQANTVASLLMEGTRRAALASEQTALFADIRADAAAIREEDPPKAASEADKASEPRKKSKVERKCRELKKDETTNDLRSCWREVVLPNGTKIELVHLSDDLFQRVRAYAQRATPYPIAEKKEIENAGFMARDDDEIDIKKPIDDQLRFPELSPERGQLLQTFVHNKIDANDINFQSAALEGLDLSGGYLVSGDQGSIDLSKANLTSANLQGADLSWANLSQAILIEASLTGANFLETNLVTADLTRAVAVGANLRSAVLSGAGLMEANLSEADLTGAALYMVDLTLADISKSNLTEIDVYGPGFRGDLPETNYERKQALDDSLRASLAPSKGLDTATLPKWFIVSCSVKVEEGYDQGNSCPAEGGWTITYEDQPEFEPKPEAKSNGSTSD